jgi:hypothetical protein
MRDVAESPDKIVAEVVPKEHRAGPVSVACTAVEAHAHLAQGGGGRHQVWAVDSGCTTHMTSSETGLVDVRAERVGDVIVGDGRSLKVKGVGRLEGSVINASGRKSPMSMDRVLVVPDLGRSLLSVRSVVSGAFRGERQLSRRG